MDHLLDIHFSTPTTLSAGTTTSSTYSCDAGSRNYDVYTPTGYSRTAGPVPLVVVLHGCLQSPSSIAADSNFNTLADHVQCIVVYPAQSASANAGSCWNWYDPANQSRGEGEPAIIAGIVQAVQGNNLWNIDTKRTYVTGLSSGAAMSVILGITYPDIFAAIGVGAGLEYKSATSLAQAMEQLGIDGSSGPDPTKQGHIAYEAMGRFATRVPALVFHGTGDTAVPEIHGQEVAISMIVENYLADSSFKNADSDRPNINMTTEINGYTCTILAWCDQVHGTPMVMYFQVQDMDHKWSGGAEPNVNGADAFTDPKGPCFTAISYLFFMLNPRN